MKSRGTVKTESRSRTLALVLVLCVFAGGGLGLPADEDNGQVEENADDPSGTESMSASNKDVIESLSQVDVSQMAYGRVVRLLEPLGGVRIVESSDFRAALEEELFAQWDDAVRSGRLLNIVLKLGMVEFTPSLRGLLEISELPPVTRIRTLRIIATLDPALSSTSIQGLLGAIGDLNTADRSALLALADVQPIPDARRDVMEILGMAEDRLTELEKDGLDSGEISSAGEWGHLVSLARRRFLELERAQRIEDALTQDGLDVLVDEYVTSWADSNRKARALEMIRRLGLREATLAVVKARMDRAPTDNIVKLLDLRDRLLDHLTDDELERLEAAQVQPPEVSQS